MIRPSRFAAAVSTVAVLSTLLVMFAGSRPALSNDIDLLRFNTAKPYVFFLLDTSASMSRSPSGAWLHGNGDDPRSRLYQAKEEIYKVFRDVDDIHFGFASMDQDKSAALSKHWLYYFKGTPPSNWPFTYPQPDPNGPEDDKGFAENVLDGDLMTFGKQFSGATGVTCSGTKCATSCTAPLSLASQREKINRFSKLGSDGSETTEIYISTTGNKTYRLTVTRLDSGANPKLGEDGMNVIFDLDEISSCSGGPNGGPVVARPFPRATLALTRWTDFLMLDKDTEEGVADLWSVSDINDPATCITRHPFSGQGWEGNYDGQPVGAAVPIADDDSYPVGSSGYNLKKTTAFDGRGRPLDRGDVLPLDWLTENKDAFLDRLAPNQSDANATPDFHIASYFQDQPDTPTSPLKAVSSGRVPLFGAGPTPLSKSVVDFRCWYQGEGHKCNETAYASGRGWESIAKAPGGDSEWGCRRPYLIVISDGDDNCPGENPCADTADLNSKSSVRTWVITFDANLDCKKAGNPLKCMAQNGKGELVCADKADALEQALRDILGQIREETRAFASAAVPSIQTTVDQRVFLTDFTPINSTSVWDGHLDAYLKPVPPVNPPSDLRPDRSNTCQPNSTAKCHLWDAGEVMVKAQANPKLGNPPDDDADDRRRVYYTSEEITPPFAASRRLFQVPRPRSPMDPTDDPDKDIWVDLLRVLGIPFTIGDTSSEDAARARAQLILDKTLAVKNATITTVDPTTGKPTTKTIQYLLGDIFHSNPLVVGSPPNTKYFTDDLHGYRDFFRQHEFRRKMAVVGSNDGMLHVFDAGIYRTSPTDPAASPATTTKTVTPPSKFDNGSGRELFAYIPRMVMPTIRQLAEGTVHQWGVDGTVTVADVFIDPENNGGAREWRTVIFGGLREGGVGYYALDVTQPDTTDSDKVPQPDGAFRATCATIEGEEDCGPLPFPSELWDFTDTVLNSSGKPVRLDEDSSTAPDLGDAWSIPNIGRIRLTEGGTTIEKYVMVMGGGFDRDHKTTPSSGSGTWLYMIDVETGKAIYKRKLDGAAPSEPAAVDTDQDGFLDRIYIGTTTGRMYRVDLGADAPGKKYPALIDESVHAMDGNSYTVQRVPDTSWKPRLLFNASSDGKVRPIFYRPSVIYVPALGLYALSFGTGDREDLWSKTTVDGRYYVFVDESELLPAGTVLDASRFQQITLTSPGSSTQFLLTGGLGSKGWFLVLAEDERLITDPFALSGVSFFSTYQPDIVVSGGRDPLCSKTGTSRLFVVSTVNGNPFLQDASGNPVRYATVNDFVTNPFTEDRGLKSGSSEEPTGGTSEICDTDTMNQLRTSLMSLFPVNCRFGNQTIDIKTVSSKTALVCIAPVPVCTIEKNWREH